MKREVRREKKLPAFSLGIGELEALWTRLAALFEKPESVYAKLEITLPSEKLEFKSIEELRQYPGLQGRVTKFSLTLAQADRYIALGSSSFASRPEVTAIGETEAWCAGAIETTYSFLLSNKLWYSWFVTATLGWVLLLCANAPTLTLLLPKEQSPGKPAFVAWLGITVTLAILYFFKGKLLPSSVLVITQRESFVRRHAAELSLVIALASLVLTVIGWFVVK
jgi:hypothetical protein